MTVTSRTIRGYIRFHAAGEDTARTVDTANVGHDLYLDIWAGTSATSPP
jgi:hypothetical protein